MRLCQLIEAEYTKKSVHDHEFAVYAKPIIGFDVTTAQVRQRRAQLGIESTVDVKAAATRRAKEELAAAKAIGNTKLSSLEVIRDLQARVGAIEMKLADLLK
jgi:hypothetical protein